MTKSVNLKEIESIKSGRLCEYLVVDQLPTKFRSYDVDQILVRGLFYEESLALSKYIGNTVTPNYKQLSIIYEDVIRGVDILDLELVDFIILMIISSIWTVDGFGWDPNIRCSNITHEGKQCDGIIRDKIILDDFDFKDPLITQLPIPLQIGGKDIDIGAITVRDVVQKEDYIEENPDCNKKIIDYATLIKNESMTFDDKVNFIKYSYTRELESISTINSEIHIMLDLLIKNCPTCKHPNKLKIGLTEIRGYP